MAGTRWIPGVQARGVVPRRRPRAEELNSPLKRSSERDGEDEDGTFGSDDCVAAVGGRRNGREEQEKRVLASCFSRVTREACGHTAMR